MTKIPDDLRRTLVEVLMCVPGGDDPAGRAALLLPGIPHNYFMRNPANLRGDVMLLVSQVEEIFGAKGEWRLLQLVDNALPVVRGTELGRQLQRIRGELVEVEKGLRPAQVHPAEVAQLHLFDLRKPVFTCLGMLPDDAKVSGFVVTTPTPKLLSYFCDSLKQRGAEYILWSRDEVAPPIPPQVIDPKHTAVTVVVNKSDKVRSLVAKKHVIWPIYVGDATDAVTVWRKLDGAFDKKLGHHLVIVFGMPAGTDVPPGMVLLPTPRFTSKDISTWVGDIGKALTWHEAVTQRWASVILVGCAGNADDLPIDMVYEQLELHCRCITQNRSPHDLMNALEDLEVIVG